MECKTKGQNEQYFLQQKQQLVGVKQINKQGVATGCKGDGRMEGVVSVSLCNWQKAPLTKDSLLKHFTAFSI